MGSGHRTLARQPPGPGPAILAPIRSDRPVPGRTAPHGGYPGERSSRPATPRRPGHAGKTRHAGTTSRMRRGDTMAQPSDDHPARPVAAGSPSPEAPAPPAVVEGENDPPPRAPAEVTDTPASD